VSVAGPLDGVTVLNPRAEHQAGELTERLEALGADVLEAPVLRIEPGDEDALDAALLDLADGAHVAMCVTSPNGPPYLAAALRRIGRDARTFAAVRTVAAIGPGTAEALWDELRLVPDLLPDAFTTEGLADAFPPGEGRVLLPRADIATNMLADGLRAKGYEPVEVAAYRTVRPEGFDADVLARLTAGQVDLVALASSSTVRNFAAMVDGHDWSARLVSIGPVTSDTCRELGLDVAVEADPHDLDGLVTALVSAAR
jgi:uroporphyrinogen-III synthase